MDKTPAHGGHPRPPVLPRVREPAAAPGLPRHARSPERLRWGAGGVGAGDVDDVADRSAPCFASAATLGDRSVRPAPSPGAEPSGAAAGEPESKSGPAGEQDGKARGLKRRAETPLPAQPASPKRLRTQCDTDRRDDVKSGPASQAQPAPLDGPAQAAPDAQREAHAAMWPFKLRELPGAAAVTPAQEAAVQDIAVLIGQKEGSSSIAIARAQDAVWVDCFKRLFTQHGKVDKEDPRAIDLAIRAIERSGASPAEKGAAAQKLFEWLQDAQGELTDLQVRQCMASWWVHAPDPGGEDPGILPVFLDLYEKDLDVWKSFAENMIDDMRAAFAAALDRSMLPASPQALPSSARLELMRPLNRMLELVFHPELSINAQMQHVHQLLHAWVRSEAGQQVNAKLGSSRFLESWIHRNVPVCCAASMRRVRDDLSMDDASPAPDFEASRYLAFLQGLAHPQDYRDSVSGLVDMLAGPYPEGWPELSGQCRSVLEHVLLDRRLTQEDRRQVVCRLAQAQDLGFDDDILPGHPDYPARVLALGKDLDRRPLAEMTAALAVVDTPDHPFADPAVLPRAILHASKEDFTDVEVTLMACATALARGIPGDSRDAEAVLRQAFEGEEGEAARSASAQQGLRLATNPSAVLSVPMDRARKLALKDVLLQSAGKDSVFDLLRDQRQALLDWAQSVPLAPPPTPAPVPSVLVAFSELEHSPDAVASRWVQHVASLYQAGLSLDLQPGWNPAPASLPQAMLQFQRVRPVLAFLAQERRAVQALPGTPSLLAKVGELLSLALSHAESNVHAKLRSTVDAFPQGAQALQAALMELRAHPEGKGDPG